MSNVILEVHTDRRAVEALIESGVTSLHDDAVEIQDDAHEDIDYVRIFSE